MRELYDPNPSGQQFSIFAGFIRGQRHVLRILIVGDAIIGHTEGAVRLLPAEKYGDIGQARDGLRRVLKYNFDSLIVGDGTSIVGGAKPLVEQMLA